MYEEEKDLGLNKNITIIFITILVIFGLCLTPYQALINNVEISISKDFLNALISISTSFFSIFAVIIFFVYPEFKKNLEQVENKAIGMPQKMNDLGVVVNDEDAYQRFSNEKSVKVKELRIKKNRILISFSQAFILNIISLSFILGKYLVSNEVYITLFSKVCFIFVSTIPMFVGIGIMLWAFLQLIILKSDV